MELEVNKAGFYLEELYPYLGPGLLCQNRNGWRQWLGLPLLQRPGYLSFMGNYASYWQKDRPVLPLKEFGLIESCQYCRGDFHAATQGRLRRGFMLVEEVITLEETVTRKYLHLHHLSSSVITGILAETFHDLRFGILTTEKVKADAVWS